MLTADIGVEFLCILEMTVNCDRMSECACILIFICVPLKIEDKLSITENITNCHCVVYQAVTADLNFNQLSKIGRRHP